MVLLIQSCFLTSVKTYALFCLILVTCIIYVKDIVFQRRYGWVKYVQCDVPGVEEDEVTVFLAVTLIQKTPQVDGVKLCTL